MTTITATYSPDDNKLRLSASTRLPADLYARVKAAGFAWAPKQEQFIAPMWTPERADLCIELAGDIEDDDGSLQQRAEDRAERFEGYEERRRDDAEAARRAVERITDGIPLGQPILVGHHSERHARRDAERIENGMRRAVQLWDTAQYWQRRAAAALAHAERKERPDVRHRRIRGLESDQRKHQKAHDAAERFRALWDTAVSGGAGWKTHRADGTPTDARSRTLQLAGMGGVGACDYGLWSRLDKGEATPEQARDEAMASCERSRRYHARWMEHIGFRLAYERAMLDEAGGIKADRFDLQPGGVITHRGRRSVIVRVNRKGGAAISVSVTGQGWTVGVEEITAYEPPTAESAAAVATVAKLAPLANYETPGCARMTQTEWKAIHADHKGARTIKATDTHGAHRLRYVMGFLGQRYGAPRGESWGSTPVFLTDAKVAPAPAIGAAPRKSMARKIAEAEGIDTGGAPDAPAPTREEERAAARAVIAEAAAPVPPTTQPDRGTPTAQPAGAEFAAMRESLRAGVQVAVAPQLFPTPPELAARMVALADVKRGSRVLEPSAGTGRLLDALRGIGADVYAVEVNRALADRLGSQYSKPHEPEAAVVITADFLTCEPSSPLFKPFDAIVMNPPFERGADVEHVTHALRFLAPGGRLVAIMSAGLTFREDRATRTLRQIITDGGGTIEPLPEDTFSSAGTGVRTVLVTYTRDDDAAWQRATGRTPTTQSIEEVNHEHQPAVRHAC